MHGEAAVKQLRDRYPQGHTVLNHSEICRIPYENASRTEFRNLPNGTLCKYVRVVCKM